MKLHPIRMCLFTALLIFLLLAANLCSGSVQIPLHALIDIMQGHEAEKASWTFIVWQSRLPQAATAILCGGALAASGLMLQTAFHNPLADSSILGISAGAGLGAALVMLALGSTLSAGNVVISGFMAIMAGAFIGAIAVMGIILTMAHFIKNYMMLLIAGIMIGYIASSAITLLNFFANAEGVQSVVLWGMGSFGGVSTNQLPYFAGFTSAGLLMALLLIKPLNALLLGERYAENLGVNIRRTRHMLLVSTGLLTATTTAFCGPVSFIGLAVPHIARLITGTSNHKLLMPFTILLGSCTALVCNLVCVLPGDNGLIPLNAVTPAVGAPVIIYVIINQRKIQYFN